jgi:hypothetical protein
MQFYFGDSLGQNVEIKFHAAKRQQLGRLDGLPTPDATVKNFIPNCRQPSSHALTEQQILMIL